MIHSLGLDGATVALPAGIDLDARADRMNQFWRALVRLQYRDVVVVAVCATGGCWAFHQWRTYAVQKGMSVFTRESGHVRYN